MNIIFLNRANTRCVIIVIVKEVAATSFVNVENPARHII